MSLASLTPRRRRTDHAVALFCGTVAQWRRLDVEADEARRWVRLREQHERRATVPGLLAVVTIPLGMVELAKPTITETPAATELANGNLAELGSLETMEEDFGSCTNFGECVPACPADIQLDVIALLNRDDARSMFRVSGDEEVHHKDRRDIPWLSRLRSGPWWQSDPDDQPHTTS